MNQPSPKTQNPKKDDNEKTWIIRKLDNGLRWMLGGISEPMIKGKLLITQLLKFAFYYFFQN